MIVLAAELAAEAAAGTVPLALVIPVVSALVIAVLWAVKIALSALRENREIRDDAQREYRETAEKLHAEVVALTREALTAIASCTAALEDIRDAQK